MRFSPARTENAKSAEAAFTRLELLVCIGAALTVLLVTIPGFANTRGRSQQAGCMDNLRQIGQAIQLWAVDHDNRVPWRVPASEFGTIFDSPKPANVYFEFSFLSNVLVTPKILACPSDETRIRRAATDWSTSVEGGYRNVTFRHNSTSYTIGLHASLAEPTSYLSSDRNLRVDAFSGSCGLARVNGVPAVSLRPLGSVAWTNSIHGLSGNILMVDGRVVSSSSSELRSHIRAQNGHIENGTFHLLIP